MKEIYRLLMRAMPPRESPDESVAGADSRTLGEWIDTLPLVNFGATSSELLEKLRWMNKVHFEPLQRLEMLEIIRHPVSQCISAADTQILGSTFPLTAQKAALAGLTEKLEYELSLGYVEAFCDLCSPKQAVPLFRRNQATLAAFRALQHGGQCLQKSYQCYHAPLPGVWQSMHDVYRVVVDLKLHNRPMDGSRFGNAARPRHVYTNALLLSLINPYSFTFRELPEITAITRLFAPLCDVREASFEQEEQGGRLHIVDTHCDVGPGFVVNASSNDNRNLLGIDITRVHSSIQARLNAAPENAQSVELPTRGGKTLLAETRLLRQLVASLTADNSRDFERAGSEHKMDTVIGLHDLHHVLAGNQDFRAFAQRVFGSADGAEHEVMASWVQAGNEPIRISERPAYVLDQSVRGYRLRWITCAAGDSVRAKVGEVIGLCTERDDESIWTVGSIRWIRINKEGEVEAGIEVLSRRALPVAVRLADDAGPSRAPSRGLLLAPLHAIDSGDYSTLLVPAMLSPNLIDRSMVAVNMATPRDGSRWWVDAGARRIDATGLLDRSGSYIHLRLPSMSRADDAASSENPQQEVDAD